MAEKEHSQGTEEKNDWSAFLCEVCDQPFAECYCYKLCENCELPTNECICNNPFSIPQDEPRKQHNQQSGSSNPSIGNGGICIYFLQGRCTYGENCKYSHGMGGSYTSTSTGNMSNKGSTDNNGNSPEFCKFFQSGNCKFGKSCRFSHSMPIKLPTKDSRSEITSRLNNISEKVGEKDFNSLLSSKMAQLMDLRDEIGLLEDVLSQKRELESSLEMEISSLQQGTLT